MIQWVQWNQRVQRNQRAQFQMRFWASYTRNQDLIFFLLMEALPIGNRFIKKYIEVCTSKQFRFTLEAYYSKIFFFLSSANPVTNDIYTYQKHLVLVQASKQACSPSKFHKVVEARIFFIYLGLKLNYADFQSIMHLTRRISTFFY